MIEVFAPSSIGTLRLKNRILRAATHDGMATADGAPAEDLLKTYRSQPFIIEPDIVNRFQQGQERALSTKYFSSFHSS
jgi:2,4-dienoyl-CoA reductase-like NADH-dependent reductase (Old Yellow Enzyme family)